MSKLTFYKLRTEAVWPTQAYEDDAGLDLRSISEHIFQPFETRQIETGIGMANLSSRYFLQIHDRSSRALLGWAVRGGVVDSGYRGELKVIMQNVTTKERRINLEEKIAQVVVHRISLPRFVKLDQNAAKPKSNRGASGFGSSDTHDAKK
jgi:dUTP pyrophosphatase